MSFTPMGPVLQLAAAIAPPGGGGGAATLALEGSFLVSPYKPLLIIPPMIAWAWVVSSIYDKDAARFYLNRRMWNLVHIAAGVIAVGVVLAMPAPVSFWITWPVMIAILAADLAAYFFIRNRDSRVPEKFRWSLDFSKIAEQATSSKKEKSKRPRAITMVFKGPGGDVPIPDQESQEFEIRVAAEELIARLLDSRGVQLDIGQVKENVYGASFMVDGVRQAGEQMPAPRAIAIMDFFKLAAGLDVSDRRRRLSGDLKLGPSGVALTPARITTQGTSAGMQLSLLLDPAAQVARRLDELGLLPNQYEEVMQIISERQGVVLLAAPRDHGRTTTLYAVLRAHDAYTSNVQSLEITPQGTIEGARQTKFEPTAEGAEFSTTLRSILRRDPDVVGVADLPDDQTAKEVAKADHSHTRVYLSMIADGDMQAIQVYAARTGDQSAAATSLYGVIAQKLVRKLCQNCRVPFQPTPDVLKKAGLPPETKQLFKKGGQVLVKDKPQVCPVCGGTGYFGQVGAFTVHAIGVEERDLITASDFSGLRQRFRQKKQQSIQSAALQRVLLGETSIEEVLRITASPDESRQAAAAATKPATAGAGSAPGKRPKGG